MDKESGPDQNHKKLQERILYTSARVGFKGWSLQVISPSIFRVNHVADIDVVVVGAAKWPITITFSLCCCGLFLPS